MSGIAIILLTLASASFDDGRPGEALAIHDFVDRSILVERPPVVGAELAGLPHDVRPETLTWERIYALALIRGRTATPAGARRPEALDPKALDEESKRLGVADFARFRADFLGDAPGFHDPSAAVLDLLARAREYEGALANIETHRGLFRLAFESSKREAPVWTQPDLDRIDSGMQRTRLEALDKRRRYRDGLDALKVELGLSPRAPVVLDRGGLGAFRDVFDAASRWSSDPRRRLDQLDGIALGLPALDDVAIDGRSLIALASNGIDDAEDLLRAGARLAIGHRGPSEDADAVELRVRNRIRRLIDTILAYAIARRDYVLLVRQRDRDIEGLIALAPGKSPATRGFVAGVILIQGRYVAVQDRLVDLWTSYQAQRLALFRDLGILPYDDWKSFLGQFTARRGDAPQARDDPPPP